MILSNVSTNDYQLIQETSASVFIAFSMSLTNTGCDKIRKQSKGKKRKEKG